MDLQISHIFNHEMKKTQKLQLNARAVVPYLPSMRSANQLGPIVPLYEAFIFSQSIDRARTRSNLSTL